MIVIDFLQLIVFVIFLAARNAPSSSSCMSDMWQILNSQDKRYSQWTLYCSFRKWPYHNSSTGGGGGGGIWIKVSGTTQSMSVLEKSYKSS